MDLHSPVRLRRPTELRHTGVDYVVDHVWPVSTCNGPLNIPRSSPGHFACPLAGSRRNVDPCCPRHGGRVGRR
jgi:hypothetical protein